MKGVARSSGQGFEKKRQEKTKLVLDLRDVMLGFRVSDQIQPHCESLLFFQTTPASCIRRPFPPHFLVTI